MSKKKPLIKKQNKIKIFILLNIVVIFFLALTFGKEYVGNSQIEHEIAQMEQERAMLEQDRLNTLGLIDTLSSEDYLEKEGRLKYGLSKEGETLIVVQDKSGDFRAMQNIPEETESFVSNPKRWFYYFFDKQKFERESLL
ncbi:hypothetical protein COY25_03955 [Candidatus Uhrbacteria bacterium CG_4_10_14_0_2_um_filter_41_7]|uniref:Septum formation initiator n=1 Tax=Candidatus Uhrbacteria bacterium CG_4_9_14_3_um_filter_41_35 TaxID=1975034 RepID=A0A2M7XDB2_9BACT|nr:MAG: hypothetical protein COV92_02015 [Candidatus Uhrbacteria bacterium CG11_big_fil_rev_8_21_14_0_20_41_9]PIZ53155.1 MAG: hypothetical protein COY25_03955 [Candidatus Uhrbacteria bacterium CG_4_10_14_0_2_um_filter_41_7]PJA45835.1 MAG: hypothetical protein CO173_04675 [Candidatus Uhrbacteria bacterium CG_4_9_14_3_um_filter_41_35]